MPLWENEGGQEAEREPRDLPLLHSCPMHSGPLASAAICPQAYTSQFISLVMFGLMMSEDRISLQDRRREIIHGLQSLPGMSQNETSLAFKSSGRGLLSELLSS